MMHPSVQFELVASAFHRDTGKMRPGKDAPTPELAASQEEFDDWFERWLRQAAGAGPNNSFWWFHNALRIIRSIDGDEFICAIDKARYRPRGMLTSEFLKFSENPVDWFTRADRKDAEAVFAIIAERQPKGDVA